MPNCRDSLERSRTCLTASAWKSLGEYAKSLVKALINRTGPLAHKPTHLGIKVRKVVSWQLFMLYRFLPLATKSLKESLSRNQIHMVKYRLLQSHCTPLFISLWQPTDIKITSVRITSIMKISTSQYKWNILYATAICENRLIFWTMWDSHTSKQHLSTLFIKKSKEPKGIYLCICFALFLIRASKLYSWSS